MKWQSYELLASSLGDELNRLIADFHELYVAMAKHHGRNAAAICAATAPGSPDRMDPALAREHEVQLFLYRREEIRRFMDRRAGRYLSDQLASSVKEYLFTGEGYYVEPEFDPRTIDYKDFWHRVVDPQTMAQRKQAHDSVVRLLKI